MLLPFYPILAILRLSLDASVRAPRTKFWRRHCPFIHDVQRTHVPTHGWTARLLQNIIPLPTMVGHSIACLFITADDTNTITNDKSS